MTRYGHFGQGADAERFVLTDPNTPRKWQNYLVSETMMVQLDQFGRGMSRYWNERGEDVILFGEPERSLVVRDPDGSVWSPTALPDLRPLDDYRCEYDPAYWSVSGGRAGCAATWRITVPEDAPVELWTVTLANRGDAELKRDVFVYLPVNLMGYCINKYRFYGATTMFTRAFRQDDVHALWVKSGIPQLPHDRFNAFLACDVAPTSTDTARDAFMGHADSAFSAAAVLGGQCTDSEGYFGDQCLAMHHRVTVAPGSTTTLNFVTGATAGPDETRALCARFLAPGAIDETVAAVTAARCRERSRSVLVSGLPALDSLGNTWAKCQNRLGVLHRKGFRDVLQDASGMTVYDPPRAREGIEEVISVQRSEGAGIRAWKPFVDDMEYSDGPTWIPQCVATYLRETGDMALLDHPLPYFGSDAREPVWDHMIKGVRYLFEDRSERGLCRIRFADWNDGLDSVGREGKGDSTMVTFGLVAAIRELRELADVTGRSLPFDDAAWIAEIGEAVERHAWTGAYYLRGYRDDGKPYGSPENEYGQIYLNAQGWAVLSGTAPRERWDSVLQVAIDRLGTDRGLRLFVPCYPEFDPYLGRVSAELPGVYENGAMYNHGAAFFLQALMKAGRVDDAWRFAEMMVPDSVANPSDRSGTEPFVLTNCIFGKEAHWRAGMSYFGWFTGTAAWMLRLIHNGFTGLSPEYDGLHVRPGNIPAAIGLRSVTRTYRDTVYNVTVDIGGERRVTADGETVAETAPLPLRPGGAVDVRVRVQG